MSKHLPECPTPYTGTLTSCICNAIRAREQRVLNEYRQKHDGIGERYFQQIRNDALAAAVQRVEEYLQHDVADGWMPRSKAEGIIAVLKGDTE